ncbi:MAG TPA: hypothetical protein DEB39_00105 [Planctomycetaceae bacterium]|nr:hypothetical protein [Planctomycetaceae bacterium]
MIVMSGQMTQIARESLDLTRSTATPAGCSRRRRRSKSQPFRDVSRSCVRDNLFRRINPCRTACLPDFLTFDFQLEIRTFIPPG